MKKHVFRCKILLFIMAGMGFAVINSKAVTIITESRSAAYSVANSDLLQTHRSSTEFLVDLYTGGDSGSIPDVLTDGVCQGSTTGNYTIASGTVTYHLNTTYQPNGFAITTINTYSGWKDLGRVNQKYTVSFRMVGSNVFSESVYVAYTGTNNQTFVSITGLTLTGVDAVRFEFPAQQNSGVGYKEIDVIGPAPGVPYTVTGENSGTAFTVSNNDLLQTNLGSADGSALSLYLVATYVNEGLSVLTNGLYGTAKSKSGTCGIWQGTLTYNLDLVANPVGYNITDIDTYAGWQDTGRDNQNYTVSFRKVGSDLFDSGIYASQGGTISETHINIANLGLTGLAAVRFSFPDQENHGVGYRELDVIGSAPNYSDITRLESGIKVISNDVTSVVRVIEGTGVLEDITLEAATNTIRSLCQSATAGATVIDPAGQTLALECIALPVGAGGLTIGSGTLIPMQVQLPLINDSSNALVINSAIVDGRSNASFLNKIGTGTVTLNGTNSYSGTTIFSKGVLEIGSFSNYGVAGGLGNRAKDYARNVGLLFHGGTLRYSGSTPQSTDRAIRINADTGDGLGNAVIDASGSNPAATLSFTASSSPDFFENSGNRSLTLTGSNTGNNTFNIAINQTGGTTTLNKSGPGTWVITGAHNYSGKTTIEGGTLRSNGSGSGPVEVAAGATWDIGVTSQTVAGLSGTGNVVRSWGKVSTGADGKALISPDKNYIHLLDFGDNTGATVNGVTFASVGTSGTDWALTGATTLFGELNNGQTATNGYAQLLSDFYYNGNPGVLTFNNLTVGQLYNMVLYTEIGKWSGRPQNATFTNGTDTQLLLNTDPGNYGYYSFLFVANDTTASVAMARLTVNSFHMFAASLETAEPVALTVGDANNYLFGGVISGPTYLIKQGSGKLTLGGANTYSGITAVNAGTLEITKSNSLPSTTSVSIISGAVMILNNPEEQIVTALIVNGEPMFKGTWGSIGSSADHTSSLFSGTGILNVITGPGAPGTIIILQ